MKKIPISSGSIVLCAQLFIDFTEKEKESERVSMELIFFALQIKNDWKIFTLWMDKIICAKMENNCRKAKIGQCVKYFLVHTFDAPTNNRFARFFHFFHFGTDNLAQNVGRSNTIKKFDKTDFFFFLFDSIEKTLFRTNF